MGIATTATSRVNMLACRLVASPEWQLTVETMVETWRLATGRSGNFSC